RVIVTSRDGEVHAVHDGSVHSIVECLRLTATKRHVGHRTLVGLSVGLGLLLGGQVVLDGPLDSLDDVGHGAGAVRLEDLDGDYIGLLGYAVLGAGDGPGAVSTMPVAVLI